MKSKDRTKEEILYDCTGMLAENHPSIIEAMDEYGRQCFEHAAINFCHGSLNFDSYTYDDYLKEIENENT